MEHFESQTVEELTLGEQSTDGLQPPASSRSEEVRDVVELGNLRLAQVDFLLELANGPVELITSIRLEHFKQVAVAECPNVFFLLGILQSWNRVYHFVVHGHLGHLSASLDVYRIAEGRMVAFLDAVTLGQYPFADVVEVINVNWEPGDGLRAYFGDSRRYRFKLFHCSEHVLVLKATVEVNVEVDQLLVA